MIVVPVFDGAHILFDALAWGSALGFGLAVRRWRFAPTAARFGADIGGGYFLALAAGAIPGAWLAGSLNTLSQATPSLSHSVIGALVGAIIGVEIYKAVRGVRGSTGGLFVGAFALGIVIGRWGCLLSGLKDQTFGAPTNLPWAVDLGDHIGRHPVQIYESLTIALFLAAWLLGLQKRSAWANRRGFYVFCLCYGIQRFVWEFLKPYPRLVGPLNLFHILCIGLVIYGWVFYRADLARRDAQVGALPVPGPDHEPV